MRLASAVVGSCAMLLLFAVAASAQNAAEGDKPQEARKAELGQPAPDFELKGIDGQDYKLSAYSDKVVVLEWFNQDCPVSRHYRSKMNELATKYAKSGVVWLAIDSTHYQKPEKDAEYHKQHEMPCPILMDTDGKVGHAYEARTTPHMFVVNKGTLVYAGAIDDHGSRNYVQDALDSVLAGKEVPLARTQPFGCSVKYAR